MSHRKPTSLKIIEGTYRPDRSSPNEPELPVERLSAPDHLTAEATKYWPRLVDQLFNMNVLTSADAEALSSLCEALADASRARTSLSCPVLDACGRQICAGGSLVYITESKNDTMVRARAEVAMIVDADRRVAMWLSRFGLTPADRGRVSASATQELDPDSPWARFSSYAPHPSLTSYR
jgi:P27 family predicted phage terminase small subunit